MNRAVIVLAVLVMGGAPDAPKKYGCHSMLASAQYGAAVWSRPDGTEVTLTSTSADEKCSDYLWPDKILLGEVKEWMRGQITPAASDYQAEIHLKFMRNDDGRAIERIRMKLWLLTGQDR